MPVSNGSNSFSIGRDGAFKLQVGNQTFDLENCTGFDQKQETAAVNVDPVRGLQLFGEIPKGWSGSFEVYRKNAELDRLFAAMETTFNNSGTLLNATLFGYIDEAGGGQTIYKFTGVSLKMDDGGTYAADKEVKQKISFKAQTREVK
jgi:hypothetical protein